MVVPVSHLTAFVGANGMGKSTILRAVNLFHASMPQLTSEDWFNKETTPKIEITLTFKELSAEAKTRFAAYLQGDELSVTRIFAMGPNGKVSDTYHGAMLRHAAFAPLWTLSATQLKAEYNKLIAQEAYRAELPAYSSADAAKQAKAVHDPTRVA
jgi:putative ATP-dependent endonuclease of the OLD family